MRYCLYRQMSGLSKWIGNEFKGFAQQDPTVMNFVILLVVGMTTEVMSNPATAQLFLPIVRDMVRPLNSYIIVRL